MTGIDFEIHETGMLIFDENDFEIGLDYARLHQDPMQQAEYLQSEQIEQINPHISARFAHGIYFSQLANIRNPRLLQSLTLIYSSILKFRFMNICLIHQLNRWTIVSSPSPPLQMANNIQQINSLLPQALGQPRGVNNWASSTRTACAGTNASL